MLKSKFMTTSLAALVTASALGAAAPSTPPDDGVGVSLAEPCAPNLTAPEPTDPVAAPSAPKNLRIIGGGDTRAWALEPEFDIASGPFAWPDAPEAVPVYGSHPYFDLLTARPDCLTSFHFRTQANIDLLKSRAESDTKIPISYDERQDAARFEIDPSGSLPNSGSTGTPQKRVPLNVQGATSLLITWDLKIAASMAWKSETQVRTNPDGSTTTLRYLDQHKSHRLDDRSAGPWVGLKQSYVKAGNRGLGVANYFFSAQPQYMGAGTMRGSAETIARVGPDGQAIMPPEFYVQPDTWTRVFVFVEGNIGTSDNTCTLSVWLADEHRAPVQLYDRINMIAPANGIGLFRFEFDSSLKVALNGPGQQYQRNFVALKGITKAQVTSLLQKPGQ